MSTEEEKYDKELGDMDLSTTRPPRIGDPCDPDTFATEHPDWVEQGWRCELQGDGSSYVLVCD